MDGDDAPTTVSEPEAFRLSLRRLVGPQDADDGPVPPQFTARAHRLLQTAKELLDRQKTFTADPLFSDERQQQMLQVVPVVTAFTPPTATPTQDPGFTAEGGRFGGGGAQEKF